MRVQKTGGSILFMPSVMGHQAHKNLAAYGMTKAALAMLAKKIGDRITVNTIAPESDIDGKNKGIPAI